MSHYTWTGAKIQRWHHGEICYCTLMYGLVEIVRPSALQFGLHGRYIVKSINGLIDVSTEFLYKRYDLNPHIDYSQDSDSDFEYWKAHHKEDDMKT